MVNDYGLLLLLFMLFGLIISCGCVIYFSYRSKIEKNKERIKAANKEFKEELREIGIYMSKGIPVNWDESAKPKPKLKLVVNNK